MTRFAPYRPPFSSFARNVPVTLYKDGHALPESDNDDPRLTWSRTLWVERPEDMYALDAAGYRDQVIRVVTRAAWLRG